MNRRHGKGREGFPWVWLMYHALDLGLTVDDFWHSTPRAIILLQNEMNRGMKSGGGKQVREIGGRRVEMQGGAQPLSRLPRP